MDKKQMAKRIDHTLLRATATREEILHICEEAKQYGTASVCVNSCYAALVHEALRGSGVMTCCVVGFPLGAMSTAAKAAETRLAVRDGAEEIDMVQNLGYVKGGEWDLVEQDIAAVVQAAAPARVKVILETCYLTDEQKKLACRLSEEAGADFVKTSTGYGSKGCTIDDLKLMRAAVSANVRVKGSGGIRDLDTVLSARAVGASRCGVSATAKIMEEAEARYAEGKLTEVDVIKEMEGGY